MDIETDLIQVNTVKNKENFQSLDLFLTKYEKNKNANFTAAHGKKYTYNYEEIIKNTPCSREKHFGYLGNSTSPCVVVKLNKIYGWLPIYSMKSKVPGNFSKADTHDKFVYVKCDGDYGVDRDNIKEIEYFSSYPKNDIGGIPFKFFPYRNQPGYLSPLVFIHFKNVAHNVLINFVCKAYAKNIDNTDKFNQRGMTKFQLFIESK